MSCENIITYACKQKQPKTIQCLTKFTSLDLHEFDGLFNQKQQQNLHTALGIDTEFKPLTNQPAIPIGVSIDNKWYEHPDCPTKQRPPFTQEVAIADHLGFTNNPGGGKWCTTHCMQKYRACVWGVNTFLIYLSIFLPDLPRLCKIKTTSKTMGRMVLDIRTVNAI